jgi:hypothetical protein
MQRLEPRISGTERSAGILEAQVVARARAAVEQRDEGETGFVR